MQRSDFVRFISQSIVSHPLRSTLTSLGIGIGVTAVVLLTSIGEGVHRYVAEQFTQFGTTTLAIQPGKATTYGVSVDVLNTVRPLSLEDAVAIEHAPYVLHSVPMVMGSASIEGRGRERTVNVFASGPEFDRAFKFNVAIGEFLPPDQLDRARPVAVLGATVHEEIFGAENPLGARIRLGGNRFRVVGVMESKGQMLGFDLDDAVYIPVGRGLELFDREGVFEIDVLYAEGAPVD